MSSDTPSRAVASRHQRLRDDDERRPIATVLERTAGVSDGPRVAAAVRAIHPDALRSRMRKPGVLRG